MNAPDSASGVPISLDLSCLSELDIRLGDEFVGTADIAIERVSDGDGAFTRLGLGPRPGMAKWVATFIDLPQFELPYGASALSIEVWNPGIPIRVVADGTDTLRKCFEIGFCENDTVWEGWKTFRASLVGPDAELEKPIAPPLRIKWLVVIMRKGLPWQLGLRSLKVEPIRPAPAKGDDQN